MDTPFVRDKNSKALINTDVQSIIARRQQKQQAKQVSELQKEITEVKNDLLEIKQLLLTILSNRG